MRELHTPTVNYWPIQKKYKAVVCDRCSKIFGEGRIEGYHYTQNIYRKDCWAKICVDCAGFIASRWTYSLFINEPSERVLAAKAKYDDILIPLENMASKQKEIDHLEYELDVKSWMGV